jgi:hypothetical protein
LQQLRQLRDIRRDAPRLVAGEQLDRRAPPRLFFEIDIGELLSVAGPIADIALYSITSSALASS